MLRGFTFSGFGLGIFLIVLGVTIFRDFTSETTFSWSIFRFYPVLLIFLGLDFIWPQGNRSLRRPEGWVVAVIVIISIGGFVTSIIPQNIRTGWTNLEKINIPERFFPPIFHGPFTIAKTIEKSFKLPAGLKKVRVENRFGEVEVNTGTGETVLVTAAIKYPFIHRRRSMENGITLSGEAREGSFLIKLERSELATGREEKRMGADITLNVPPGVSVEVENSFGRIRVIEVKGDLLISNSNGRIEIEKVSGNTSVHNQFSSVEIETVGGNLALDVTCGEIEIGAVEKNLSVRNSFGRLKIGTITGDLDIISSNSQVDVERVNGKAKVRNSFGGVSFEQCDGPLEARIQSGNLEAAAVKIGGDYDLDVDFGNITLELPSRVGFAIDANTSLGNINSDFRIDLQKEMVSERVNGTVNGGGPLLKIRNNKGNIRLKGI